MVPYESGARRITSNLGSDLFCPLWLVGAAHLEWRARVARSCCIGRRWSVGCSPLARYLLSSCGVWWEVFSSLAETPPVVNMEVETCSHCAARLSLSYLGWTTCLPGRLFTDLGKGKAAGGNAFSRSLCSPTAIAVSRGLPLSTPSILMWSGRRSMRFGPQRVRKCNTSRICHEFGRISLRSHPRLHLQSSVENIGRRGRKDGNFRLHVGGLLLGPSGALCCSVGAFGDPSQNSTSQCVHMGSGTTTFQDLVRKGVRRRGCAAPCFLCHHSAEMELLVASTLVTSSVTTKVSKSREGRRESAHQRSLSRLETVPSLSSPLASLSSWAIRHP